MSGPPSGLSDAIVDFMIKRLKKKQVAAGSVADTTPTAPSTLTYEGRKKKLQHDYTRQQELKRHQAMAKALPTAAAEPAQVKPGLPAKKVSALAPLAPLRGVPRLALGVVDVLNAVSAASTEATLDLSNVSLSTSDFALVAYALERARVCAVDLTGAELCPTRLRLLYDAVSRNTTPITSVILPSVVVTYDQAHPQRGGDAAASNHWAAKIELCCANHRKQQLRDSGPPTNGSPPLAKHPNVVAESYTRLLGHLRRAQVDEATDRRQILKDCESDFRFIQGAFRCAVEWAERVKSARDKQTSHRSRMSDFHRQELQSRVQIWRKYRRTLVDIIFQGHEAIAKCVRSAEERERRVAFSDYCLSWLIASRGVNLRRLTDIVARGRVLTDYSTQRRDIAVLQWEERLLLHTDCMEALQQLRRKVERQRIEAENTARENAIHAARLEEVKSLQQHQPSAILRSSRGSVPVQIHVLCLREEEIRQVICDGTKGEEARLRAQLTEAKRICDRIMHFACKRARLVAAYNGTLTELPKAWLFTPIEAPVTQVFPQQIRRDQNPLGVVVDPGVTLRVASDDLWVAKAHVAFRFLQKHSSALQAAEAEEIAQLDVHIASCLAESSDLENAFLQSSPVREHAINNWEPLKQHYKSVSERLNRATGEICGEYSTALHSSNKLSKVQDAKLKLWSATLTAVIADGVDGEEHISLDPAVLGRVPGATVRQSSSCSLVFCFSGPVQPRQLQDVVRAIRYSVSYPCQSLENRMKLSGGNSTTVEFRIAFGLQVLASVAGAELQTLISNPDHTPTESQLTTLKGSASVHAVVHAPSLVLPRRSDWVASGCFPSAPTIVLDRSLANWVSFLSGSVVQRHDEVIPAPELAGGWHRATAVNVSPCGEVEEENNISRMSTSAMFSPSISTFSNVLPKLKCVPNGTKLQVAIIGPHSDEDELTVFSDHVVSATRTLVSVRRREVAFLDEIQSDYIRMTFHRDGVTTDEVAKVLDHIRFTHTAACAEVGPRTITADLQFGEGQPCCTITTQVDVLAPEICASWAFGSASHVYRSIVSDSTNVCLAQTYCAVSTVAIAATCELSDPDTARFRGGYFSVVFTSSDASPNDHLILNVSPDSECRSAFEGFSRQSRTSESGGAMETLLYSGEQVGAILYSFNNTPVPNEWRAMLLNGPLNPANCSAAKGNNDSPSENTVPNHCVGIRIDFLDDVPLQAVQNLLRLILYTNTSLHTPPGLTTIDVELQIGHTVHRIDISGREIVVDPSSPLQKPIQQRVAVHRRCPLLSLPTATFDYVENSGTKVLFKLVELPQSVDSFQGSNLRVSIVDGFEVLDHLSLELPEKRFEVKPLGEEDLRVLLPTAQSVQKQTRALRKGSLFNDIPIVFESAESIAPKGNDRKSWTLPEDAPPRPNEKLLGFTHREKRAASVLRDVKVRKMMEYGLDERMLQTGGIEGSEIISVESGERIGVVFSQPKEGTLVVSFAHWEVSGAALLSIIRGIRYSNTNRNPLLLKKVISLALVTSTEGTSAALMEVGIEPFDDPTEITLLRPQLRYVSDTTECEPYNKAQLRIVSRAREKNGITKKFAETSLVPVDQGGCCPRLGCLCLFHPSTTTIEDPDTECWDGGSVRLFSTDVAAPFGTTRFMSRDQQHLFHSLVKTPTDKRYILTESEEGDLQIEVPNESVGTDVPPPAAPTDTTSSTTRRTSTSAESKSDSTDVTPRPSRAATPAPPSYTSIRLGKVRYPGERQSIRATLANDPKLMEKRTRSRLLSTTSPTDGPLSVSSDSIPDPIDATLLLEVLFDARELDNRVVTIDLLRYVVHCIVFICAQRVVEPRTIHYRLSVMDADNPIAGEATLELECLTPLIGQRPRLCVLLCANAPFQPQRGAAVRCRDNPSSRERAACRWVRGSGAIGRFRTQRRTVSSLQRNLLRPHIRQPHHGWARRGLRQAGARPAVHPPRLHCCRRGAGVHRSAPSYVPDVPPLPIGCRPTARYHARRAHDARDCERRHGGQL